MKQSWPKCAAMIQSSSALLSRGGELPVSKGGSRLVQEINPRFLGAKRERLEWRGMGTKKGHACSCANEEETLFCVHPSRPK